VGVADSFGRLNGTKKGNFHVARRPRSIGMLGCADVGGPERV
jgi:hypothetical protein